jgi:CDP-glycerol glycerophosphotransferase (TagB/SpsB family)
MNDYELKLDLALMQRKLGHDYVLLLRLHPAVNTNENYEEQFPGFVYDYSLLADVNKLLLVADYLITDYSSIPFEFALLNKPMIFYPYDLEVYQDQRGILDHYESMVPGPVVYTTADVISQIRTHSFNYNKIQAFAQSWNRYSKGTSSKNVVDYLASYEQTATDLEDSET